MRVGAPRGAGGGHAQHSFDPRPRSSTSAAVLNPPQNPATRTPAPLSHPRADRLQVLASATHGGDPHHRRSASRRGRRPARGLRLDENRQVCGHQRGHRRGLRGQRRRWRVRRGERAEAGSLGQPSKINVWALGAPTLGAWVPQAPRVDPSIIPLLSLVRLIGARGRFATLESPPPVTLGWPLPHSQASRHGGIRHVPQPPEFAACGLIHVQWDHFQGQPGHTRWRDPPNCVSGPQKVGGVANGAEVGSGAGMNLLPAEGGRRPFRPAKIASRAGRVAARGPITGGPHATPTLRPKARTRRDRAGTRRRKASPHQ